MQVFITTSYNGFIKKHCEFCPAAWVANSLLLTFGLEFANTLGKCVYLLQPFICSSDRNLAKDSICWCGLWHPDEICHCLRTQPCLFWSHAKTSLISHICSCLSNTRERKTNELEATPNIYPHDIWHLPARRGGDSGHPLLSWLCPIPRWPCWSLPQSRHWLWSLRSCGLGKATSRERRNVGWKPSKEWWMMVTLSSVEVILKEIS